MGRCLRIQPLVSRSAETSNYSKISVAPTYALARIVAASGIDGGKAASCLGSVYGPQVAQNDYWKKHSEIKFPDEAFLYLDTMNPTTYSAIRFAEIVAALNDYAEGKGNKALLDEYFTPQVQIKASPE